MKIISCFLFILSFSQTCSLQLMSIGDWGGYNLGGQYSTNVDNISKQMYQDYKNSIMKNNTYKAVLNTGDNFYYCGIQNLEDINIKKDFVKNFIDIDIHWISSLGNHDYAYNVSAQLHLSTIFKNWVMPKRYYKTKIGNVNIYVLDTNPCIQDYINDDPTKWDPCSPQYLPCTPYKNNLPCKFHENILNQSCSNQYQWYSNDLERNINTIKTNNEWIITIGHHMIGELNNQDFINTVDKYSDLYINGHDHVLGLYKYNNNLKYITSGAGSMVSLDDVPKYQKVYSWYERITGYTTHNITNDSITTNYIDTNGNIIQSFVVSYKHTNNYNDVKTVSSDCGSNTIASNIIVSLNPETPKPNQDVSLEVSYDLSQDVTSGYIIYKASLNGFPVVNSKNDLCNTLKDGDEPCPLTKGSKTTKSTVKMPNISGLLDSTMSWYSTTTTNVQEIFCIHIQINL